jgi:hypothetical protein
MAGTAATVGVAMTAGEATAVTIADIAADIDRVRSSEARCGGGPSFSVALQVGA